MGVSIYSFSYKFDYDLETFVKVLAKRSVTSKIFSFCLQLGKFVKYVVVPKP